MKIIKIKDQLFALLLYTSLFLPLSFKEYIDTTYYHVISAILSIWLAVLVFQIFGKIKYRKGRTQNETRFPLNEMEDKIPFIEGISILALTILMHLFEGFQSFVILSYIIGTMYLINTMLPSLPGGFIRIQNGLIKVTGCSTIKLSNLVEIQVYPTTILLKTLDDLIRSKTSFHVNYATAKEISTFLDQKGVHYKMTLREHPTVIKNFSGIKETAQ